VLDGDEAGHLIFCVSVRSFSGVTEDFTSADHQVDLQVSLLHSRAWSLVLGVLFLFTSCFFRCQLCGVSSRSEIDFGYLPIFGIFACCC
jgi:hypothetical protein